MYTEVRVLGWEGQPGIDHYVCTGCRQTTGQDRTQRPDEPPPKLCLGCDGKRPYQWLLLRPGAVATGTPYVLRSGLDFAEDLVMLCQLLHTEHNADGEPQPSVIREGDLH